MIRKIKRTLGIRFSLKALIRNPAIYLRQWRLPDVGFADLVRDAMASDELLTLVQVGANDGATNDPVGKLLHGNPERFTAALLIEPQGPAFARLAARYADVPQVTCLQAAIDRESGERSLFTLDRDTASERLGRTVSDGIASFDRDHLVRILRTYDPSISQAEISGLIQMTHVPVMPIGQALETAGIAKPPTIVLIDTEGYDGAIIHMLAEAGIWPRLIQYEHKHLDAPERRTVAWLLLDKGYRLRADHADAWGWREV
ncbi:MULTISPECIES: hypothetical protein [unclassified Minwuia]|jgi:FkbM family methyltransferase|uniref:hypothetical protein n=1 Tax=unclassified Minwuia TaxID=2618799 RepID=UPI002478F01B|nr:MULTISPECIES: hypothetical protein [unclassified Minwuia]